MPDGNRADNGLHVVFFFGGGWGFGKMGRWVGKRGGGWRDILRVLVFFSPFAQKVIILPRAVERGHERERVPRVCAWLYDLYSVLSYG